MFMKVIVPVVKMKTCRAYLKLFIFNQGKQFFDWHFISSKRSSSDNVINEITKLYFLLRLTLFDNIHILLYVKKKQ